MRLFMQTVKQSTGDKTPPMIDPDMKKRLSGSAEQGVFMFFLTFVWSLQQVFAGVLSIAAIAIVTSSYEKNSQGLRVLLFRAKAKFNEENLQRKRRRSRWSASAASRYGTNVRFKRHTTAQERSPFLCGG